MDLPGAPMSSQGRPVVNQPSSSLPGGQSAPSNWLGAVGGREAFRQGGRSSESLEQFTGEDTQQEKPSNVCKQVCYKMFVSISSWSSKILFAFSDRDDVPVQNYCPPIHGAVCCCDDQA